MNYIKLNYHTIFIDNISFIHYKYNYGKLDGISIFFVGGGILHLESYYYEELKKQLEEIGVEV